MLTQITNRNLNSLNPPKRKISLGKGPVLFLLTFLLLTPSKGSLDKVNTSEASLLSIHSQRQPASGATAIKLGLRVGASGFLTWGVLAYTLYDIGSAMYEEHQLLAMNESEEIVLRNSSDGSAIAQELSNQGSESQTQGSSSYRELAPLSDNNSNGNNQSEPNRQEKAGSYGFPLPQYPSELLTVSYELNGSFNLKKFSDSEKSNLIKESHVMALQTLEEIYRGEYSKTFTKEETIVALNAFMIGQRAIPYKSSIDSGYHIADFQACNVHPDRMAIPVGTPKSNEDWILAICHSFYELSFVAQRHRPEIIATKLMIYNFLTAAGMPGPRAKDILFPPHRS